MYNFLKLLSLLGLFFLIGTATSEDIETSEYDCIIEVTDDAFILTSLTDADIINADLTALIIRDTINFSVDSTSSFFLTGYFQEALTTDTILFSSLMPGRDTITLSSGAIPTSFNLDFFDDINNIEYSKVHLF